ncbi:MAG: type II secretion system F family protein [Kiritimatiellae bacterium]|nr:type II secretion system F family protein [Kiritimatiellia bacterium]
MSLYTYTGRDAEGRRKTGWTEADTPKAARAALDAKGILTESIEPARPPRRVSAAERATFYNTLGVHLDAGFPLEQAFGMLIGEAGEGQRAALPLHLRGLVRDGVSLSDALVALIPSLPAYERTALRASEEAGFQGGMLQRLADFIENERAVGERIRGALAYPLAVLFMATSLLAIMVYVVLPRAIDVFDKVGDALPASARRLAEWGPRGMTLFLALLVVVGFTAFWLHGKARTDTATATRVEKLLCRLPVSRRALPLLWAHRFAGTMALLVGAGVAPQSALAVSGAATGSAWLASLAEEASAEVKAGATLRRAAERLTPIAPLIAEWVAVGESSGSLGKMLDQASARCRQTYETTLARFLGLLEPVLIVAVGVVVLIVTVSVLGPMLQLARSAGG